MAAARKPTQQITATPDQVRRRLQQGRQPVQEQPFVHAAVSGSPEAIAYQKGLEARQAGRAAFSKYTEERPVDPIQMPPLEQPHHEGMTMSQQAAMYGATPEQRVAQHAQAEDSIVEGPRSVSIGSMDPSSSQKERTPAQMGLTVQDVLPPEARHDPEYRQGQGSDVAVNQPNLAMKYGVIRNGQKIPAQALQANVGGEAPGRRSVNETLRDLSALANAPSTTLPQSEEEAERQVEESSAGQSQNAGRNDLSPEERKRIEEAIATMDDFDFAALRRQMEHDQLNNPEQRSIIEARLQPLDLGELIMHDRVSQTIPVRPGVFWFEFRSMTGEEDMGVKRLIMQEAQRMEVADRYYLEKHGAMSLACGLSSICGRQVPYDHLDEAGNFDPEKFWLKFAWVLKRPLHALSSMGINHTWFEMRVRKLFIAEKVKNG